VDAAGLQQAAAPAATIAETGFGWWRALGGTLAVFALLVLFLRLLSRWQTGAPRRGQAALLAVLPLGARREIEVLRLGARVHYVYRRDGALVLLGDDAIADWEVAVTASPEPAAPGAFARLARRIAGPVSRDSR